MGGGPPGFPQGFSCPAVLRYVRQSAVSFSYRAFTYYGWPFQDQFTYFLPFFSFVRTPYNPDVSIGLGSSAFARRYLRNHYCFLFLRVLRCFSSPGLPPTILYIQMAVLALLASGLPHSEISGSMFTYNSPKHIGVRPVLHRLLAPRHPPCALNSLILLTSYFR